MQWETAASDYDMTVFRDSNGDGSSLNETQSVGTSAAGTTNNESATFGEPAEVIAGKKYVVRVVNFAGAEPYTVRFSYGGPAPFVPARIEAWNLTCESSSRQGGRAQVGHDRPRGQADHRPGGLPLGGAHVRVHQGRASGAPGSAPRVWRATDQAAQDAVRQPLLRSQGHRPLLRPEGGTLRVGYPTSRLASKLSRKTRKRISRKAILLLSTSKSFGIRKIRRGTSTKALRKRLRGERRVKIGKNTWYYAKGSKSRVLFRTRKGKVLELGLGSRSPPRAARASSASCAPGISAANACSRPAAQAAESLSSGESSRATSPVS